MGNLKVNYIANIRLPNKKAHGIQLAKMCEAFVRAGVNLELIVPWQRGLDGKSFQEFYGLQELVRLKQLPVINIFPRTRLGFNLRAFTFAVSYFFYLKLRRVIEPAVLYTIDLDQFSFFFIPFLGLPYFFETHAAKRKNRLYNFFLKRAKGIIAINSWIKNDLTEKFGLGSDKILVFPNGIDLEMFNSGVSRSFAREKLALPQNIKIIVYIGRFYDWKGLGILLRASDFLVDDFVFYLVGGTERQFKDIEGVEILPENIVCVGEREYQEMPIWMAAADALLVLGTKENLYSYRQTSPMKIFEYMASRRPIVASRTPAIEEIVSESEVIFYEPDSSKELAAAVRSALEDLKRFNERAENAFIKVRQFSWLKRVRAIQEFMSQNL